MEKLAGDVGCIYQRSFKYKLVKSDDVVARVLSKIAKALSELSQLEVGTGEVAFIFYKISALAVKTCRHRFLIDPAEYFSLQDVKSVSELDAILITHEHYDHFDASSTVKMQEATGAMIVCNPGAYGPLKDRVAAEKLMLLEPDKTAQVKGAKITAIGAVHPGNKPIMFIVEVDEVSFFHGSDSGYTSAIERYGGGAKLAFVPVGKPSPTASVQDAVKMVRALGCNTAIPIHGSEEEASGFRERLQKESPNVRVIVPEPLKIYKV
jgi:L-ascorbate metabolism protein UlaG (beta-lactamase superfamily)